jgi:hypothetical protein
LCLDENGTEKPLAEQKAIAIPCGCNKALVYRVSKRYKQEGREGGGGVNRKVRQTPPVPPTVTGEAQAKIIVLRCGEPPEGYSQRTLWLLGSLAAEMGIVEHISAPAVGRILKKTV